MTSNHTLSGLFYTILRRRIADHYDSQFVKRITLVEQMEEDIATTEPADHLGEDAGLAQRLLSCLTPNERQAYTLYYAHALKTERIAETMGRPKGTICSWLDTARKKLAFRLQELERMS